MTHKVVLEITSKKLFTLFSPFTSWYRFCRNTIYLIVLKKSSIGILVISFKMADFFLEKRMYPIFESFVAF